MHPAVYYLCPDSSQPSWGIAILYKHVELLARAGVAASIVHRRPGFSLGWLDTRAPVRYGLPPKPRAGDLLVAPEVLATDPEVAAWQGRKWVFVQGAFLIEPHLQGAADYASLGFEQALVVLPHLQHIVQTHYGIDASVVPPYIAPYFFVSDKSLGTPRPRTILLLPKKGYREVGYHDEQIVRNRLRPFVLRQGWQWTELQALPHLEVARAMAGAAFLLCVNSLEAFNTVVPEAMAAGCLPVCYEGFGGRDFLRAGSNAFVFGNNDVFALIEQAQVLIADYGALQHQLAAMRQQARKTAEQYTEDRLERALLSVLGAGS